LSPFHHHALLQDFINFKDALTSFGETWLAALLVGLHLYGLSIQSDDNAANAEQHLNDALTWPRKKRRAGWRIAANRATRLSG